MQQNKFYQETVAPNLWDVLNQLMKIELLSHFRLVGGTALSLQLGHRISVDIDLFTEAVYDSIDFIAIDKKLQTEFPFVNTQKAGNNGFGKAYYVGRSKDEAVKVDMYYTDPFIRPIVNLDTIRMASIEEIAAMKIEAIGGNGRKKDFWDIHELLDYIPLVKMLEFHSERYPYSCSTEELKTKLVDFQQVDDDFDPKCLRGKYWELIKKDIQNEIKKITN
jgi:predicted nucleotidyltransferase